MRAFFFENMRITSCNPSWFAAQLVNILEDNHVARKRTIVFCNTATCCDWLGHHLNQRHLRFIRLHGNIPPKVSNSWSQQLCNRSKDLQHLFQSWHSGAFIWTFISSGTSDFHEIGRIVRPISSLDQMATIKWKDYSQLSLKRTPSGPKLVSV